MSDRKPFFVFMGLLLLAAAGFALYVYKLESCTHRLECHKLYLAFGVLFAVGLLLVLGAGFYALLPAPGEGRANPGKEIFDAFLKSLLPIVTLVLGYYFGSASKTDVAGKSAGNQETVQKEAAGAGIPAPAAPR